MPFLDGIATSIHGIVLPDGVVALRPVEMVTLRRGHELRYAGCATFWDPPDAIRERDARAPHGASANVLRDEVDFRGAFTLDGVATVDGFRPTELNPRFGAGLGVITRGLGDTPLHLVLDLVVAGIRAGDLRRRPRARDPRPTPTPAASGGTWQLHVDTPRRASPAAMSSYDDGDVALVGRRRAGRRHRRRQRRLHPRPVRRRPHAGRAERRSAQRRLLALRRRRAGHRHRPAHRRRRRHRRIPCRLADH